MGGTEKQHVDRGLSNEKFANGLSPVSQGEWKVIASFYAAVHYVEAVIVRNGGHSTDHNSRDQAVRVLAPLKKIRDDYFTLKNFAWEARYDPTTNFGASPKTQEVCDLLPEIRKGLGF